MDRLLAWLTGLAPLPPTRFVGYEGPIGNDSWVRLLEALRNNREAVGVRLRGCGLGCEQTCQLSEALAKNAGTCLEVLELPDNNVGERGVQALVDTLRISNCTLKSVDLSGNPCQENAVHALQELDTLLKRNRVMKKLPKTPLGLSDISRMQGSPSFNIKNCTPADGLSTPHLAQALLATGLTPHGLPFQLEQRLQHLEEAEATIRSELEHVRSFSSQSEVWQKKIDAAGQQIAAILSLVDGRNMTLEARLQTMEHWRSSAEQAWAGQSKVLEDMAAQMVRLMWRVQVLETQVNPRGAASKQPVACTSAFHSVESEDGLAALDNATNSQAHAAGGAGTLWQELAALGQRMAALEAAAMQLPPRHAAAPGEQRPSPSAEEKQQRQQQVQAQPCKSDEGKVVKAAAMHRDARSVAECTGDVKDVCGSTDGAEPHRSMATGAFSSTETGLRIQQGLSISVVSELSSVENLSPQPMNSQDPGHFAPRGVTAAAACISVSPSPLDASVEGNGSAGSYKACPMQQQTSRLARIKESLKNRRSGGVKPLQVPQSPILWHVNSFAVSPGSCAMTPTNEHGPRTDFAQHERKVPIPLQAAATAAMAASSSRSCSQVSSDPVSSGSEDSQETVEIQQTDAGCVGVIMYAAAPNMRDGSGGPLATGSSAAKRYAPLQQGAQDVSAHPQPKRPAAAHIARHLAAEEGEEGGCGNAAGGLPGHCSAITTPADAINASVSSPGTPRASTFSVDADTVSLSVAMAGSAARPRAPAATSTDTPFQAHAVSTKEPNDLEVDSTGPKEEPPALAGCFSEPILAALAADSRQRPLQRTGLGITATAQSLNLVVRPAASVPASPPMSVTAFKAVGSVGTSVVSVGQWAAPAAMAPSPTTATYESSRTPTSKRSRHMQTSPTPTVAGARPGPQLSSPPLCAAQGPRRAPALRNSSRPSHDAPRISTDGALHKGPMVPLQSPRQCEGHGSASSRPLHALRPHHHAGNAACTAATTMVTAGSRARDGAGCDKESLGGEHGDVAAARANGTSATSTSRGVLQQHHSEEDSLTCSASDGAKSNAASSQTQQPRGGGATDGGHRLQPPVSHGLAGPAGNGSSVAHVQTSWLSGRAGVQAHPTRSSSARGDSGMGPQAAKPASAHPNTRASGTGSRPAVSAPHRPSSSMSSTPATTAPATTSGAFTRSTMFSATAPAASAHDHPLRYTHNFRVARQSEGHGLIDPGLSQSMNAVAALAVRVSASDAHYSHEISQGNGPGPAVAIDGKSLEPVHRAEAVDSHVGSHWAGGAFQDARLHEGAKEAGGVAGVGELLAAAGNASTAAHHQPQISNRGYRLVGGTAVRTLAPGTAGNVVGPAVKGGAPRMTTVRMVTSVAGATKRWM